MFHLDIQPVRTTSQLRSAANAAALEADGYEVDDGYVIVETQAEADELISRHSNLELDLSAGAERSGELERATVTGEGVKREAGEEAESGPSDGASDDTADGSESDEDGENADEGDLCAAIKSDGEVCGRDRPCQYHD